MPTTVRAIAETVPPSHHAKATDRETRELIATADTYEQALADVRSQVLDGSRLMMIYVDR